MKETLVLVATSITLSMVMDAGYGHLGVMHSTLEALENVAGADAWNAGLDNDVKRQAYGDNGVRSAEAVSPDDDFKPAPWICNKVPPRAGPDMPVGTFDVAVFQCVVKVKFIFVVVYRALVPAGCDSYITMLVCMASYGHAGTVSVMLVGDVADTCVELTVRIFESVKDKKYLERLVSNPNPEIVMWPPA
jgi:hypothetical protein